MSNKAVINKLIDANHILRSEISFIRKLDYHKLKLMGALYSMSKRLAEGKGSEEAKQFMAKHLTVISTAVSVIDEAHLELNQLQMLCEYKDSQIELLLNKNKELEEQLSKIEL